MKWTLLVLAPLVFLSNTSFAGDRESNAEEWALRIALAYKIPQKYVRGNQIAFFNEGYCFVKMIGPRVCSEAFGYVHQVGVRTRQVGKLLCESGSAYYILTPLNVAERANGMLVHDKFSGYPQPSATDCTGSFEIHPPKIHQGGSL